MSSVYNKNFILASSIEEKVVSENRTLFEVYPLEKGYATTIGNCIRRTLLSGIDGVAVYAIKIDGISNPISSIQGVYQDVSEIIFNVKNIILKTDLSSGSMSLKVKGSKVATAGDISCPEGVEIVNSDLVLFEVTENVSVDVTFFFKRGLGFSFVNFSDNKERDFGKLDVDVNFNPVLNVAVKVEDVRAGDVLRYEKLVMDISTNGACSPRVALDKAIALLMDNIGKIAKLRTVFDQDAEKNSQEDGSDKFCYNPNVFRLLEDLEISVRSLNALRSMGCVYIGDLAILSEDKILSTPNLGRKSSDEIENILKENGLTYNTQMPWINDGALIENDFERLSLKAQEYFKKKGDDSKLSSEDYIY